MAINEDKVLTKETTVVATPGGGFSELTSEALNSVSLDEDARGNIHIAVKVYNADINIASKQATDIFEPLAEWAKKRNESKK